MQALPHHLGRLLITVLVCAAVNPARAQNLARAQNPPRPVPTQPASETGDAPADVDDVWREPDVRSVLTTAAEVHALTPDQAESGRPVKVRGVVTYIGVMPPVMFVHDSTGGLCVVGPRDRDLRTHLRYGMTVQVEGVTSRAGDVACVVSPDANPVRIEVFTMGRVHAPRLATVAQLGTPGLHGELVEVEGVVRSVRTEHQGAAGPGATVITLAQGGGRVEIVIMGRAGEAIVPEQTVGAVLRVRGVFNAAAPPRMEVVARRLLLRSTRDFRVVKAPTPAQDVAIVPIRALDDPAAAEQPAPNRLRVQGVVTLPLTGRGMFVQDSTGGVWVRPAEPGDGGGAGPVPAAARAGDAVEVMGFPGRRGWSTVLADSTWNVTGKAAQPEAPLVTAERALAPEMDARLVRIDALVLSVSRISQHTTFALKSGDRVFLARLADSAARPPPAVTEGSWVRLSGVCVQTPLEDGWGAAGAASPAGDGDAPPPGRPPSFYLLLASDRAVQVIGAPGWWTLRRVLVVCGLLAAVAVASTVWVVALRRRVARQTRTIREHLAKRALYEERVRIARDLHDSLEQDLLGITMQLNATEKLLAHPDRARQSLQLAAAMVRRSQAETHRAVWDLREQRPGTDGLVSAIREAVAGLQAPRAPADSAGEGRGEGPAGDAAPDRPRVEVRAVGESRPLPAQMENHLLRVALEAVTNAVKHSGASLIEVELTFAPDRVEVLVRDDGRGFDAERLPPPSSGHFGLFGMRERAEKLGGALTIRSRPGGGTDIRVVVDTNADPARATRERATAEAVAS